MNSKKQVFLKAAVASAKEKVQPAASKYAGLHDRDLRARIALLAIDGDALPTLVSIYEGTRTRAELDDPALRRCKLSMHCRCLLCRSVVLESTLLSQPVTCLTLRSSPLESSGGKFCFGRVVESQAFARRID